MAPIDIQAVMMSYGVGQKHQFWLTQSGMQDKDTQRENEMVKETIKGIRIPPAPPGQH